jgi:iron complex transport system substrate-binding protein
VKIVSLLPSATEIVYALGLADALEGVSFGCDYPPAARDKRVISRSALAFTKPPRPRQVDEAVTERVARGEPICSVDTDAIREIQPDLILAQDLCRVCAVSSSALEEALEVLGCRAEVISLDPTSLEDVIACVGLVGEATGTIRRAQAIMGELRKRIEWVRQRVAGRPRRRTVALEWSDPPYSGGHWVPDMIEAAGGCAVLGEHDRPSRRLQWSEVAVSAPEVVIFMPCGYGLKQAVVEGKRLLKVPELRSAKHVYAVSATDYFSRPGPRVVDGVEILAWALHPDAVPAPDPGQISPIR